MIDFKKAGGLVPAVIQDALTLKVLMLGYMDAEAFAKTQKEGRITFYSRSRKELWTKGMTSGNYFNVAAIKADCDNDALLITVYPEGPACHTGQESCFATGGSKGFLYRLEKTIEQRISSGSDASYTKTLFGQGINKIAQKVGEEAVELVIEAKDDNKALFEGEAADLLFHFLILLKAKELSLADIENVLMLRDRQANIKNSQ